MTDSWVEKASGIFGQEFKTIPVVFDLKGRTSGMFCMRDSHVHGKQQWIRYNPWIFAKHFEDSLATTVPHEVAHYICHLLYGQGFLRHKKIKPHGQEWKAIMVKFGVPANTTCKLDISDVPQKRLKRFTYQCTCSTHELTSIRHNRIARGRANYACPKCNTALKLSAS